MTGERKGAVRKTREIEFLGQGGLFILFPKRKGTGEKDKRGGQNSSTYINPVEKGGKIIGVGQKTRRRTVCRQAEKRDLRLGIKKTSKSKG